MTVCDNRRRPGPNDTRRWFLKSESERVTGALAGQSSVERQLGILIGKVEGIEDRLERADDSRAAVHRRLDDLVLRTTHLESDVSSVNHKVEEMQKVTDDVIELRAKAAGAGTLGHWLLRIGIGVVTLAGWIVGAYAYLTGRPPP